jgi:RHS repeat-associated protein
MDSDGDGTLERRVMYLQDRAGHVIGVFDTALARQDSPTDTTLGLYPVRIAYTAFGVPVNVGASGLGLDEGLQDANGMPGSRLDVDFDNDGFEDDRTSPGTGSDLEKLIAAVNAGSSSNCGTIINGVIQPCDSADFNRDGEVNGDDITAFIAAKQGTYYVPAGDIGDYRFLYRGYWYDRHLHIYHVRHRAYDPEIQRWLQPDPAYFVDGLNRYAYCGNEPVHMYDPMGLWGEQTATRIANSGGWYQEAVGYGLGIAGAMQESVATSLISIVNPMTYVNAVQNGIAREDAHAARGAYEATVWHYVLAVTGEFVGANELADAGFYGIDVIDGREVGGWERFERGAGGAVQMVGTAAGSAAGAIKIVNIPVSRRFSSWRAHNDIHLGTGFWDDLKAKVRGETFVDGMDLAEATRYADRWESHASSQSSPHNSYQRYDPSGKLKQIRHYDEFGRAILDLDYDARHGYHAHDWTYPQKRGGADGVRDGSHRPMTPAELRRFTDAASRKCP